MGNNTIAKIKASIVKDSKTGDYWINSKASRAFPAGVRQRVTNQNLRDQLSQITGTEDTGIQPS